MNTKTSKYKSNYLISNEKEKAKKYFELNNKNTINNSNNHNGFGNSNINLLSSNKCIPTIKPQKRVKGKTASLSEDPLNGVTTETVKNSNTATKIKLTSNQSFDHIESHTQGNSYLAKQKMKTIANTNLKKAKEIPIVPKSQSK